MIGRQSLETPLPQTDVASLAPIRRPRSLAASLILGVMLSGLAACERPHPGPPTAQDMSEGAAGAPVTVIEYASVACSHCAAFNNTVFPAFKAKYIDRGDVRYILREALTGDTGLAAAGFLTARCAGKDRYFQVVDDIFRAQAHIYASGSPETVLLKIAEDAGLSESRFEACIGNSAGLAALKARWSHAMNDEGIRQTPTFVINGKLYEGEMSLAEISAAVDKARSGAGAR
jgi:protein-disulfide isomerase